MDLNRALIAFGGNLGDVRNAFATARRLLEAPPGNRITAVSRCYRTPPLGPGDQPEYLNAVVRLETPLSPEALLELMQGIERRLGRTRSEVRWQARTIDLDLLDFNGIVLDSPRLVLPHPRMHRRQFVLRPLCDIAPDWQHPRMHTSASALLARLIEAGESPLPEGEPW